MYRLHYLLIFGLGLAAQSGAQRLGGIGAWFAAPSCGSVESGNTGNPVGLTQRARTLARELPEGRERAIAQALVQELEPGRLQRFCRDPATGELVARYSSGIGATGVVSETESAELRVKLQNLSYPEIAFHVTQLPDDGGFNYLYRLSNKSGASRPITSWGLMSPEADRSLKLTHPTWQTSSTEGTGNSGVVSESEAVANLPGPGVKLRAFPRKLVRWTTTLDGHPVQAGASLTLFSVTSEFRPGWTTAYVGSDGGVQRPEGKIPAGVEKELNILLRPENYYSPILTIGPQFGPDVGHSWIAGNWHLGIQRMVKQGRLSPDSAYVAELLRSLAQIAQSELNLELSVSSKPAPGMEALLDKIVRMAL